MKAPVMRVVVVLVLASCSGAEVESDLLPETEVTSSEQPTQANPSSTGSSCTYGYLDADGDGFGAGPFGCYSGRVVQNRADCCDSDSRAYPGTTAGYSGTNGCGSWDYNCDGTIGVTNGGFHYAYNTGGAAASYSDGYACTRGTYTGFYRSPAVPITSASCGTYVKIQPCWWYYYGYANCTGLIGYHLCADHLVHCN